MDNTMVDLPATEAVDESLAQGVSKTPEAGQKPRKKKKKVMRAVTRGRVYIQATYNNTIVTITDADGNVLAWSSSGKVGFKGPKKSTSYAAGIVIRDALGKIQGIGFKEAAVFVKGVGAGREAAVRALNANGVEVTTIKDITPIPHNGPRAPKVRRV